MKVVTAKCRLGLYLQHRENKATTEIIAFSLIHLSWGQQKWKVCFLMEGVLQPGLSNYLRSVSTSNFYPHRLQERYWPWYRNLFCLLLRSCTLEPFSGHWLCQNWTDNPGGVVCMGATSTFTRIRSGQTGSHTIFWLGGIQEYHALIGFLLIRIAPTNIVPFCFANMGPALRRYQH